MATDKCIKCGSYAFNLYKEDIDQGGLCDVHYWQYRAHRAEALAEQPAPATELREQEPVAWINQANLNSAAIQRNRGGQGDTHTWSETPTWDHSVPLYTSPTAQRTWVGLTNEDLANCSGHEVRWALYWEKLLKERNT